MNIIQVLEVTVNKFWNMFSPIFTELMSHVTKEMSVVNTINAHGQFSGSLCEVSVPDKYQFSTVGNWQYNRSLEECFTEELTTYEKNLLPYFLLDKIFNAMQQTKYILSQSEWRPFSFRCSNFSVRQLAAELSCISGQGKFSFNFDTTKLHNHNSNTMN